MTIKNQNKNSIRIAMLILAMSFGLIASANVADHLGSIRATVSETEESGGSGRASRASLQAWDVIADSLDCGDYYLVIEIPDSVKYRKG